MKTRKRKYDCPRCGGWALVRNHRHKVIHCPDCNGTGRKPKLMTPGRAVINHSTPE